MASSKIKKGDTVRVIAGKAKNNEGKVIAVDHKNNKVTVEGLNMVTKHTKPSAANPQGGIIQVEAPMDLSNVMYVHKGKATRVGFKMDGTKKVRYAKSTGDVIDVVVDKKKTGKEA
jgi:large subunit ribosomal protein L24